MTRAVLRFVRHTIRHDQGHAVTFAAFCLADGCAEESGSQETQDAAQDWCLRHCGRTGHDLFRRLVTDRARVTPDE
ncbi:hypothetical protein ACIQ6V_26925 [Streptomyces sp. NPDC096198]|uniref:DUF7848 domain-containing protein n=1 Tax=Streptomyces sp. NPDC096198 TaxID=3366080 RepID=UPI00380D8BB9